MGNGLAEIMASSSATTGIGSVITADEGIKNNSPITQAANSTFFMPFGGVRMPEGSIERYIPIRFYGAAEMTARVLNYVDEGLAALLAKQVDYIKIGVKSVASKAVDSASAMLTRIGRNRTLRQANSELKKIGHHLQDDGIYYADKKIGTYRATQLGFAAGVDYRYPRAKYALERAGFISVGYTFPK